MTRESTKSGAIVCKQWKPGNSQHSELPLIAFILADLEKVKLPKFEPILNSPHGLELNKCIILRVIDTTGSEEDKTV